MTSRWKDQTVLHDPATGQYGNCMQACIASLLDLPMAAVPHFHHDGCDAPTFWDRVEAFLHEKGFALSYGWHYDAMTVHSGPTERGTQHCVIKLGDKTIHDPHPCKGGLIESTHTFYLVPFDPSK